MCSQRNKDMELAAVFTRRDPSSVQIRQRMYRLCPSDDILDWKDRIDVLMLCGGSAKDLPVQTPEYAKYFNVIDSFDTHANIPEHFAAVDAAAKESGQTALILRRLGSGTVLPDARIR